MPQACQSIRKEESNRPYLRHQQVVFGQAACQGCLKAGQGRQAAGTAAPGGCPILLSPGGGMRWGRGMCGLWLLEGYLARMCICGSGNASLHGEHGGIHVCCNGAAKQPLTSVERLGKGNPSATRLGL